MRVFIAVLLLIFSLQSWTKADDIRDFEIEGMSIGDSALKFFTEKQIKNNTWDYPNNKFKRVQNDELPFFNTFDAVDFNYKTGDKNYIFVSLSGIILTKSIEECINKQKEIAEELESIFPKAERSNKDEIYNNEQWKGTRNTQFSFFLQNEGGSASVHCMDYSKEHGGQDHLSVNLKTKKFNDFLFTAYD